MLIKQVRSHFVRVPDPLRPGRYAQEERLLPTGCESINHAGKTYEPVADGWFDLPMDVAETLMRFRGPHGERFLTDADLGEQVRFGMADAGELPEAPAPKRARKAQP